MRQLPYTLVGSELERHAPTAEAALDAVGICDDFEIHQLGYMAPHQPRSPRGRNEQFVPVDRSVIIEDGRMLGIISDQYVPCSSVEALSLISDWTSEPIRWVWSMEGNIHTAHTGVATGHTIIKVGGHKLEVILQVTCSHGGQRGTRCELVTFDAASRANVTLDLDHARRVWTARHQGGALQEARSRARGPWRDDAMEYLQLLEYDLDRLAGVTVEDEQLEIMIQQAIRSSKLRRAHETTVRIASAIAENHRTREGTSALDALVAAAEWCDHLRVQIPPTSPWKSTMSTTGYAYRVRNALYRRFMVLVDG